jgi:hypothetical protein
LVALRTVWNREPEEGSQEWRASELLLGTDERRCVAAGDIIALVTNRCSSCMPLFMQPRSDAARERVPHCNARNICSCLQNTPRFWLLLWLLRQHL